MTVPHSAPRQENMTLGVLWHHFTLKAIPTSCAEDKTIHLNGNIKKHLFIAIVFVPGVDSFSGALSR